MKNRKIFLTIASLALIILTAGVIYLALLFKERESLIISAYFGVLGIVVTILWTNYSKKSETEDSKNAPKQYESHFAITSLLLSFIYILIVLLLQWNYKIWLTIGIIVFIGSAIWIFILGILSKQSLSGQEDFIVKPEKIWRIIWNMLPARFGYERNPILNVLIIYSSEGENQAKQIQQRYEQAKDELRIDEHLCVDNNKKQLENKLTTTNYIGIHLIYTEDIKSKMIWVRELCYEWANNNKSKPVVYTNYTDEDQPLNYGTSNKESDGILCLFQRTHSLSESWREQANIQHKFLKWSSVFFIITLIGLNFLFFNRLKNIDNSESIPESINKGQIVLVGGGTVKEYIEQTIDSTKFSRGNLLFIPMRTEFGCEQLGDAGFTKQLQGKVIIMSSEYQKNESIFGLERNKTIKHILEIYLRKDTFYIKSKGIDWLNTDVKEGISLDALKKKIDSNNNVKTIFHTNVGSGTYNFYKNLINSVTKEKAVYYAGTDGKTDFAKHNNYIILTRSFYDPIPDSNRGIERINIKGEKEMSPATGDLFLYIPITENEMANGRPYVIPSYIQEFLNSLGKKISPQIEVNQHGTIIRDTLYHYP
ncbi:MAG: hypothetical protein LBL79_05815 [Prevotella sp.]|jgi:hypothetical protein|nr:hypothetical protein [Prevotella sp.]